MTKRNEVYKCNVCGNIVEVLYAGGGTLVCCGEEMELLKEKIREEKYEKHVPVIKKTSDGYKVIVGSIPHPMEDKHYIEWVELVAGDTVLRQFLNPGDTPEATFTTDATDVTAREYCNLHGLWRS